MVSHGALNGKVLNAWLNCIATECHFMIADETVRSVSQIHDRHIPFGNVFPWIIHGLSQLVMRFHNSFTENSVNIHVPEPCSCRIEKQDPTLQCGHDWIWNDLLITMAGDQSLTHTLSRADMAAVSSLPIPAKITLSISPILSLSPSPHTPLASLPYHGQDS